MVARRIPNPKVEGSIPSGVTYFLPRLEVSGLIKRHPKNKKRVQPESHRRPQDLQSYALLLSYAPGRVGTRTQRGGNHKAERTILSKRKGPIGTRTRIGGFRVLSDSHYTIRPICGSYGALLSEKVFVGRPAEAGGKKNVWSIWVSIPVPRPC